MGFLNKIKMIFLGQGDISANAHTKKLLLRMIMESYLTRSMELNTILLKKSQT